MIRYRSRFAAFVLLGLAFVWQGCAHAPASSSSSAESNPGSKSTDSDGDTPSETSEITRGETATPAEAWIDERVAEAKQRLEQSKAGRIVWKSIQAHGGLKTWYANGPVYFHYNYQPVGDRTPRNTYQTVDTWSARARHQMAGDEDHEYGWDGDEAWYRPADWEPPYDVRFWALTPYYFVGMPFVAADSGVNLSHEGTGTIEGTACDVVRMTFGDVGISPDDYYVLYIGQDQGILHALRYIVSYPKYFPEGGHSPEKLMTYDGTQTVGGIRFAQSYRFYKWKPDQKTDAKKVTDATLSDVDFRPETPNGYFEVPEGSKVVDPK